MLQVWGVVLNGHIQRQKKENSLSLASLGKAGRGAVLRWFGSLIAAMCCVDLYMEAGTVRIRELGRNGLSGQHSSGILRRIIIEFIFIIFIF